MITDKSATIAEELDLIESLELLSDFGVQVLPLQVRMTKDRCDLVQMALDAKLMTYKSSQKVELSSDSSLKLSRKHVPTFVFLVAAPRSTLARFW